MMAELEWKNLKGNRKAMNNRKVAQYNQAVMNAIKKSARPIIPWTNFPANATLINDGLHFDDKSLKVSTEVLYFNLYASLTSFPSDTDYSRKMNSMKYGY